MRKILISILVVLVLAVIGILLAPSLIDWNAYRGDFSRSVAAATGREVSIDGDLKLRLLPAPEFSASKITIGNSEGGEAPYLAKAGELHISLALGPLLGGRVSVQSLLLVDPEFNLEITADGRENWKLQSGAPGVGKADNQNSYSFETVSIRNGSLLWRQPGSVSRRLDGIQAELSTEARTGLYRLKGEAVFKDLHFGLSGSLGSAGADGASALSAVLDVERGKGRILLTGAVRPEDKKLEGKLAASSPDAAALVDAILGAPSQGIPALPANMETTFKADTDSFSAPKLILRYGEARGEGTLAFTTGNRSALSGALEIGALDLDQMQARIAPRRQGAVSDQPSKSDTPFSLPEGFDASINISAKAVRLRGGIVRTAQASLQLVDGDLRVDNLSADLPGGTKASFTGMAKNADEGIRLDGNLALVSDNMRQALIWMGVAEKDLPAGHLRNFSYTSGMTVTGETVGLSNITARLDASRIAGAATIARRTRPSFGLSLNIDQMNLDNYFPPATTGEAGKPQIGINRDRSFLGEFDANLNLSADSLTWRDQTYRNLALDGRLFNGDIVLRKLSVGDLGGAALAINGTIDKAAAKEQVRLDVSLKGKNAKRFAGMLGLEQHKIPANLGRFVFMANTSGAADDLDISSTLNIAGGKIDTQGMLKGLEKGSLEWDLGVNVTHDDGRRVLKLIRPGLGGGATGPVTATFRTKGNLAEWAVTDLRGALGDMAFAGRLDGVTSQDTPRYKVDLSTGFLDLDQLIPADVKQPNATPRQRGSARWSREPFDMAFLRSNAGSLTLRAEHIRRGDIELENVDLATAISGGVMTVTRMKAGVSGGSVEAVGRMDATGAAPSILLTVAARDVAARPALMAIAGFDRLEGPVSLDLNLEGKGANMFELLSSLAGKGRILGKVRGRLSDEERAKAGAAGIVGFILGDRIAEIGTAGNAVSRLIHAFANSRADLSGDIAIDNGVARTENLTLAGRGASALTVGGADLANWRVDSRTTMRREEDGAEPYMIMGLKGPLDEPDVRISGSVIQGVVHEEPPPLAAPVIPVDPVIPDDPDNRSKPEQLLLDLLENLGR